MTNEKLFENFKQKCADINNPAWPDEEIEFYFLAIIREQCDFRTKIAALDLIKKHRPDLISKMGAEIEKQNEELIQKRLRENM